jgi:colicin import membrane protein
LSFAATYKDEPLGYSRAFLMAVILHGGLLAVMTITAWEFPTSRPLRPATLSIEAVIVDMAAIREAQAEAQRQADLAVRREQQRIRREQELAARKEQDRLEQIAQQRRQRDELVKLRAAQEERDRLAALELQRQQDELERVRQQRIAQEQAIERQAQELRELAERRKAEEAAAEQQRRLDLIAAEQLAASESAENLSLRDEYILTIAAVVTQNWLRPPSARAGLRCQVNVQQIPGGEVISAAIVGSCNGDDATRRSIIAAVHKVEYLPYNGFERVFDKDLTFIFIYDGD